MDHFSPRLYAIYPVNGRVAHVAKRRSLIDYDSSPKWDLATKACLFNDTSILGQAFSIALPGSADQDKFHDHIRSDAFRTNASAVLRSLLDRGISILPTSPRDLDAPSTETLELLLHHGWDINQQLWCSMVCQIKCWNSMFCVSDGCGIFPAKLSFHVL